MSTLIDHITPDTWKPEMELRLLSWRSTWDHHAFTLSFFSFRALAFS